MVTVYAGPGSPQNDVATWAESLVLVLIVLSL